MELPKRFIQARPLKLTGEICGAFIVGQQVLCDNALERFPQLQDQLWKHTGSLQPK